MEIRPLQQYEPELSGEDVVDQHWPFDGPHSAKRTTDALDAVARLVRYLDNATSSPDGLGSAQETYNALGGLSDTAGRLPQLLQQLSAWANELATDTSLGHDAFKAEGSKPAAETATRAATQLDEAVGHTNRLYESLNGAREHLSHLYHRPTPLAEEGVLDDDR